MLTPVKESPLVSVIIPTYNRSDYVQIAVESVLRQSYEPCELIVVDDGSTDDTHSILKNRFGDEIKCFRQENQGESVARNMGVKKAIGDFLVFLDSDDILLPEMIEKMMWSVNLNEDISLAFCRVWNIDAEGERINDKPMMSDMSPSDFLLPRLCMGNFVPIGAYMLRRNVFREVGEFDPSIQYGEDWDLMLRIFSRDYNIAFVNEPLASIRRHRDTQCYYPSINSIDRRFADHRRILQKTFGACPDQVPGRVKAESFAYQYALEGLASIMLGDHERSFSAFSKSEESSQGMLNNRMFFGQSIVDHAVSYAESNSHLPQLLVMSYLEEVFKLLQEIKVGTTKFTRWVRSRTHMAIAFHQYPSMRMHLIRISILRGVIWDPTILRNIGVMSILFESIFGSTLAAGARRIGRRMLSVRRLISNRRYRVVR